MSASEGLVVDPKLSELQKLRTHHFGEVASLLSQLPAHRARPFAVLAQHFFAAFRHGQSQVFYNPSGEPVAFVVWALLSRETEERVLSKAKLDLHLSEWNEGDRLWIVDFGCKRQMLVPVLAHLASSLFAQFGEVSFCKDMKKRVVFKLVDREGIQALLTRMEP